MLRLTLLTIGLSSAVMGQGVAVNGTVYDSLAHRPLRSATVQLISEDSTRAGRSAVTDSLGRFEFESVSNGRYTIGFFHPVLDSLGIQPPLRLLVVNGRDAQANLAVPSARQLRFAICGRRATRDSGAVVAGFVRHARDRSPVAEATIVAQWVEITFRKETFEREVPKFVARTRADGWYAVCDAPIGGIMSLQAMHDRDSTDLLDVNVPDEGFLRQDLYVAESTNRDGRARGSVTSISVGKPVASAMISVGGSGQTRVNGDGVWTVTGVPLGTRMLEVRAVGFYPDRRAIQVVDGEAPVASALSTMEAVLDTVRVTAARNRSRERARFEERRRVTTGHFYDERELERHGGVFTSQIFRSMPGIQIRAAGPAGNVTDSTGVVADATRGGQHAIVIRNAVGEWCSPTFFIDGVYIPEPTTDDIDVAVSRDDLFGIEIYNEVNAPAQYQRAQTGCGSIVIWRKDSAYTRGTRGRRATMLRAATYAAAVGVFLFLVRSAARGIGT